MPRGKPKGGHKGRSKRYMTEEEVAEQEEKRRREQEWKKKKGLLQVEDEEDKDTDEDGVTVSTGATGGIDRDEEVEEEESSDDDDDIDQMFQKDKRKGIEDLIEIENPNRVQKKSKKITEVDVNTKVVLSRREKEEIEKQRGIAAYRKKHEAGLTDEAQRDLARLAIIRKQREEAAKKRELEKQAGAITDSKKKK